MKQLNTTISNVTVYPSKALIIRQGTTKIQPNKTTIEIPNLPISLDPSSVRVKGLSLTGTMIEGIDIQKISHKKSIQPKQELLDKLQEFEDKLTKIDYEILILKARQDSDEELENLFVKDFSRYYSRGTISLEQFSALRNQLKKEHKENKEHEVKLNREKREIEREIEIISNEIENKKVSSKPDDYLLSVFLNNPSMDKEDEFQLEISYVVSGANWKPMYDFRAETRKGEILVDYFGIITQRTGEDWNEVELTLSTASPSIVTTIPEILPWYLDIFIPHPPPKMKSVPQARLSRAMKKMGAPASSSPVGAAMMELDAEETVLETEEAKAISATIEDTGEAQIFTIPKKENINSDNKPHQVMISQITNPLESDFLAIPSYRSDVIQRGKMINESNLIFLPGEIRLFEGNEFIGKTKIKQIAPTEEFTLALGITSKIKVKRKISSQQLEKKGMIAKTRIRNIEVTIEVINNRTEKTKLVIKDRIPTSKHEDIKVKIINLAPTPKKKTKLNICTWSLYLEPQEKIELKQVYEIENPIDTSITGL
ncbi:MAG: mucoidy inhibitor MuiA family protein [Candidatus Hodarchaeota archaeon]